MKLLPSNLLWCVLIVCLTLLAFTYLTRKSLCEIRYPVFIDEEMALFNADQDAGID
ncbi:Hok/Gef family protein [Klebsiella variicola]|uniref:Hok/Gef family protein n=1 Tax=Klebsiella variicola TaxID=244366 RepID=UPI00396B06A4